MSQADDLERRFWLSLREPGCVPQRKGPWPLEQTAKVLREFIAARPTAYIDYITLDCFGHPQIEHGPEVLQMTDSRSMSVGRKHNARVRQADEIARLRAENERLRAALLWCSRHAGGEIADDASLAELKYVPEVVRLRIEALEREQGWQDIATAPKDGTRILARIAWRWSDGKPSEQFDVIAWDERAGFWFFPTPPNYVQGLDSYSTLTHWRPLPPPPTGERG